MMLLLVLLLLQSGVGVHMDPGEDNFFNESMFDVNMTNLLERGLPCSAKQDEVDNLLKEGLLYDAANLDVIKDLFNVGEDEVKLCARIIYNVYNLTLPIFEFTWTSFDPHTFSGEFLYEHASSEFEIFGFEWGEACNINNPVRLNITLPAPISFSENIKDCVTESLHKLTEEVSITSSLDMLIITTCIIDDNIC